MKRIERAHLWDGGIGSRLMQPIIDLFDQWQLRQAGLFTLAQSPKHIGMYEKFGFWPQHLTALMDNRAAPTTEGCEYSTFSAIPDGERPTILRACFEVTDSIYEGLDLEHEIRATDAQGLATRCWSTSGLVSRGLPFATAELAKQEAVPPLSSSERSSQDQTRRPLRATLGRV